MLGPFCLARLYCVLHLSFLFFCCLSFFCLSFHGLCAFTLGPFCLARLYCVLHLLFCSFVVFLSFVFRSVDCAYIHAWSLLSSSTVLCSPPSFLFFCCLSFFCLSFHGLCAFTLGPCCLARLYCVLHLLFCSFVVFLSFVFRSVDCAYIHAWSLLSSSTVLCSPPFFSFLSFVFRSVDCVHSCWVLVV